MWHESETWFERKIQVNIVESKAMKCLSEFSLYIYILSTTMYKRILPFFFTHLLHTQGKEQNIR